MKAISLRTRTYLNCKTGETITLGMLSFFETEEIVHIPVKEGDYFYKLLEEIRKERIK